MRIGIKEVYDVLLPLRAEVSSIKTDLREHMRRTAMLEAQVDSLRKGQYMAIGAISFLTVVATVVSILKYVS
jgi:hypothetical protein